MLRKKRYSAAFHQQEIDMNFSDVYPLRPFQVCDPDKLQRVISAYPLATVISQGGDFPAVSQVPLIFDPVANVLRGHLDRNNPHCAELKRGGNICSVFNGPNHYMSPAIYPDTQYPGWNYIAVHVEGTVRAIDNLEWLKELLIRTAELNEPSGSGYQLSASQDNFHALIKHILGFEIEITDMRGIFKLAQDKGDGHAALASKHLASVMQRDITEFLREMLEPAHELPRS